MMRRLSNCQWASSSANTTMKYSGAGLPVESDMVPTSSVGWSVIVITASVISSPARMSTGTSSVSRPLIVADLRYQPLSTDGTGSVAVS